MYPINKFGHNWLIKRRMNALVRSQLTNMSGLVLDLGCGTSPFREDILRHATLYVGVDWAHSPHASRPEIVADLSLGLPFRGGIADHVVSFEVLEHLAEPAMMLQEAARVLKPTGKLTLSAPFQWWVHEAPWDYQRFTKYGLKYQLDKAGFTDIVVIPTTGFWSMWTLKVNYQLARLPRGPRWLQAAMRAPLVPVWWFGQSVALLLDRVWHEDRETAGYFVTARKA